MKTIVITGAAGFIGFHLSINLLNQGYTIIGIDNINDYYDVNLKYGRLAELGIDKNLLNENGTVIKSTTKEFYFYKNSIEDYHLLEQIFSSYKVEQVVHLAAQAGVRYSLENPHAYGQSNLVGFLNILEICRNFKIKKLLYASSSSIYGNSVDTPFKTTQNVDHPISLYAATKKANELMAHSYSHLYGFQTIGLRFFTVYGPWGRPDMAMFLFTDAILNDRPIKVFNHGDLARDFTYIDDIVQGIDKIIMNEDQKDLYQLYNIGNNKPVQLLDFIKAVEIASNKKAVLEMLPMQPGDVNQTWADIYDLSVNFGYEPKFPVQEGVNNFVEWYKSYFKI